MESFSIILECPDPELLLDELWPKLDDYCTYEVFEYASGKVMMITFEKFLFRVNSNLLAAVALDFTHEGKCQVDIVSGGGGEGILNFRYGSEKSIVRTVMEMFIDISDSNGWKITENDSLSSGEHTE
jgi:hypothetical protein